jgi:hypothetical protein
LGLDPALATENALLSGRIASAAEELAEAERACSTRVKQTSPRGIFPWAGRAEMRFPVRAAILIVLGSTTVLSGCAIAGNACANAFEKAAQSVDEVSTANFGCSSDFGHPNQSGSVFISADSDGEALPVIEEVYRAFASSSKLEDAWKANLSFYLDGADITDPEEQIDSSDLGIGEDAQIHHLREHYDIRPPGAD